MRFRKYHGAGNDFVMVSDHDGRLGAPGSLPPGFVSAVCDRHTGIGADGVIRVIGPGGDNDIAEAGAAFRMDYYNADGGPAEMCGNGIRCLVEMERRHGALPDGRHVILTAAGIVTVETLGPGRISADMGVPSTRREDVPMCGNGSALRASVEVDGLALEGSGVSMGNPHFVLFVPTLDDDLVFTQGPRLEHHPDFPERTNVEFVAIESATRLRVRVWERGVGETQACGSGACAAAVAAACLERAGPHVIVAMPGGELEVQWDEPGSVWLTGPAEEVFEGEIDHGWLEVRGLTRFASVVELL